MKNKPLVAIYQRHQKKGIAIYLHYTINGKQQREATNLRLTGDKETDKKVMAAATMLQAERTADILAGRSGIATANNRAKMLVTTWLKETAEKKIKYDNTGHVESDRNAKGYISLSRHLEQYKPNARLLDIDTAFCSGFVDYMRAVGLSKASIKSYYTVFVVAIGIAVKEGILQKNEAAQFEGRPKATPTERVYLTESEIKAFAEAETKANEAETRAAFLFSFYTGLRYSDIKRLTPAMFDQTNEGLKFRILTQKTKKYISFTLPEKAAALVSDRLNNNGTLFDLKALYTMELHLKAIAKRAGIAKNVSFHTARHTFATMLLTKGADIYTISTMLGHSNIATTEIYAKIVDKKKDNAAQLLGGVL